MCLLPAAIVFIGGLAIIAADEFRTGKEATEDHMSMVMWATFIFGVLGIIFR